MLAKKQFIFILILFISTTMVQAASFYASKGLGMYTEGIGAQGLALGGSGIALMEERALSSLNPATFIPAGITRVSLHFYTELNSQKNNLGTGFSHYVNAHGGQFLVPIGQNVSFSLGLAPLFISDYAFESEAGEGGAAYRYKTVGKGSLNKAYIGAFLNIKNRLALGLAWNYTFGKYEEDWQLNYFSDDYYDTSDVLKTRLNGYYFTTGAVLRLLKTWNLGAVVSTPVSLKSEHTMLYNFRVRINDYSTDRGSTILEDGRLELPLNWGIGTSFSLLDKRLAVIAEYFTNPLSKINVETETLGGDQHDYHRVSFGLRFTPSNDQYASYLLHVPLRAGFYYKQLQTYYGNDHPVKEYAVTFGAGLPFFFTMGRLDLTMALGKRGNLEINPVEENFIRVMVSVTGGEKWFIRGRKN